MKIGYPAINLGLGHTSSHTFRLASLSEGRFNETVRLNLDSLMHTLKWNVEHGLYFYRISSSLIPFASHPAMTLSWKERFREDFERIGNFIKQNNMRISMHPGQYVVINSPNDNVYENSVKELQYHADVLDMLGLDRTHKFQFHLGGIHNDRDLSTKVFLERYNSLSESIKGRLVIENDERFASVKQCMAIHDICGIPILFDTLHHQVNNNGETLLKGLVAAMSTWNESDGVPMIDYSTQNPDKKVGAHAVTLDVIKFRSFAKSLKGRDIDIMLEIKNKEASALQAKIVIDNL